MERDRLDTEIASLTLRALRRVLRSTEIGNRELALATGLTPSQWLVLREIDSRGQTNPSAVAQALQFSQATITALVDRLVALDFVRRQRSDLDKRQVRLEVTPAGKAALVEVSDPLQANFTARFAALQSWEQAMLLAAVERLATLLDAQGMEAAPLLDSGRIDRARPD